MLSSMKGLFFIKKTEINKENKARILTRVTIDGLNAQFNTKYKVVSTKWDTANTKGKGRLNQAQETNGLFENIPDILIKYYWEILNTENLLLQRK
ncbi:MAG: hypothetical protein LUG18_10220 [Candidatus Azobacteroides sp.]|nr:hypothetical protein [Candidatus Azobacteroides sp.]